MIKTFLRTVTALLAIFLFVAACPFLITTGGNSSNIPVVTQTPSPSPTPTPTPIITSLPSPTPAPSPDLSYNPGGETPKDTFVQATVSPSPEPTATPIPTPAALPMDDFSIGAEPIAENFTAEGYEDDSIQVKIGHEQVGTSRYNYAYVKIAHPSQLRVALGGNADKAYYASMYKIATRSNAIVAINGDFYPHRRGNLIIRQATMLQDGNGTDLDMLFIDFNGDFHLYNNTDVLEGIEEMKGNIYQAFSFGPALIIDGVLQEDLLDPDYDFGLDSVNPRTAIGQIGPLEYLLVVVDGRRSSSAGVTTQVLGEYMLEKGCTQAFNLDGGGTSYMFFQNRVYNMTTGNHRSMYDIIYFASTDYDE